MSSPSHRSDLGAGISFPPTDATIPSQFEGNHVAIEPPPTNGDPDPVPPHLLPSTPGNFPTTSFHHSQPTYAPYPPPPNQCGPGQPFPLYFQPPIGATSYQPFYPPPAGPPFGHTPYMPQPEPTLIPMPGPYAGPPQSFARSPVPPFQDVPQPYSIMHSEWYLGVEIPPLHSKRTVQDSVKVLGYDPKADAQAVTNAARGRTLDKKEKELLIRTLAPLSALQIDALAAHYQQMTKKTLLDVLPNVGILNDYFGMGIHGLAAGPLAWDVELVGKALAPRRLLGGLGTDETLLNELILCRPVIEIRILTEAFRLKHGEVKGNLTKEVKNDLSLDTARMFELALDTNRPDDTTLNLADVEKDVDALYHTGRGNDGKEKFYQILVTRSFRHTLEMISLYESRHGSLSDVVKRQYSGHMKEGLLYIVNGAESHAKYGPGVWRDAQLIYNAMDSKGRNDKQLVWRLVRAHWDTQRMAKIKEAYRLIAKEDLAKRVHLETTGPYRTLLVALVDGAEWMNR